jgi:hypothetical protein
MSTLTEIFGEVIDVYSRANALEDGVLIDLGQFFHQGKPVLESVGIRYPVAITSAAFGAALSGEDDLEADPELPHKVVHLLRSMKEAINESANGHLLRFKVVNYRGAESSTIDLKAMCGPGDDAEPVLTVMLPDED